MLSLGRTKSLRVLQGKPRPDANSVRVLPCKHKISYSPETQHGRRMIKVYRDKRPGFSNKTKKDMRGRCPTASELLCNMNLSASTGKSEIFIQSCLCNCFKLCRNRFVVAILVAAISLVLVLKKIAGWEKVNELKVSSWSSRHLSDIQMVKEGLFLEKLLCCVGGE